MSDKKRQCHKTCDMCARITARDMARRFCPVAACMIHQGKSADSCKFFVMAEDFNNGGYDDRDGYEGHRNFKRRRRDDVR